jgi:hypothetical protein
VLSEVKNHHIINSYTNKKYSNHTPEPDFESFDLVINRPDFADRESQNPGTNDNRDSGGDGENNREIKPAGTADGLRDEHPKVQHAAVRTKCQGKYDTQK